MDDPPSQTTKILTHLSKTLSLSPPQSTHPPATLTGLPTSHTGTAYLFLSVSAHHPRLQIHSYPAIHWARAYISNIPTPSAPISLPSSTQGTARDTPVLGLLSDDLAGPAIRACVTKDLLHVRKFLAILSPVLENIISSNANAASSTSAPITNSSSAMDLDAPEPISTTTPPLPSCLLHGLAGTLYLLRLIRHWVPSSAPLVCGAIVHVSEYLLGPHPWTCPSRSPSSSQSPHSSPRPSPPEDAHGTTHGDLGIVTQLVLTSPPLAASPSLTSRLAALLDLQLPNGDWPASLPTSPSPHSQPPRSDVQQSPDVPPTQEEPPEAAAAATTSQPRPRGFASGPQGLVISLLSLRPFFPSLHDRIDDAVEKAREFLWARAVDSEGPTEENLPKRPQKNPPLNPTTPLAKPTALPAHQHQCRRHHISKPINAVPLLLNNANDTTNSRLRNDRNPPGLRIPPRRRRARYAPHDILQRHLNLSSTRLLPS
ncbi:abscisic acid ABA receptor [Colletotrichum simmondsii]|uniref:Abscisic acid ABA receptor n=1 Tax=Colletotrichum simmondsii TaxID=703756 RepID=A0A135RRE7_9PEZI|nr:abscisic acid ABA receptor [Colletotrichum simmondsii]